MTIEERLENMERELACVKRRNRWLLGAILVLLGGLVATGVFKTMITPVQAQGAGTVKEIRANKIVLEDENGTCRAALAVGEYGPSLALWDEKFQIRALLGLGKDGPLLKLLDEKGQDRFAAGKTKAVSPDGKTTEYPESSLILFGPDGKVIWSAIK